MTDCLEFGQLLTGTVWPTKKEKMPPVQEIGKPDEHGLRESPNPCPRRPLFCLPRDSCSQRAPRDGTRPQLLPAPLLRLSAVPHPTPQPQKQSRKKRVQIRLWCRSRPFTAPQAPKSLWRRHQNKRLVGERRRPHASYRPSLPGGKRTMRFASPH